MFIVLQSVFFRRLHCHTMDNIMQQHAEHIQYRFCPLSHRQSTPLPHGFHINKLEKKNQNIYQYLFRFPFFLFDFPINSGGKVVNNFWEDLKLRKDFRIQTQGFLQSHMYDVDTKNTKASGPHTVSKVRPF